MTIDELHRRVEALGLPTTWCADSNRVRTLGARLLLTYTGGEFVGVWEPKTTMPDVPSCAFSGSLVGVIGSIRSHVYRWVHMHPELREDFAALSQVRLGSNRTRRSA